MIAPVFKMASKLFRPTLQIFRRSTKSVVAEIQFHSLSSNSTRILYNGTNATTNSSILIQLSKLSPSSVQQTRLYNLEKKEPGPMPDNKPSPNDPIIKVSAFKEDKEPPAGQKLKLLVRDYGPVAFVVHISLSLVSLGFFYLAIEWGVPVERAINTIMSSGSINPDSPSTIDTQAVAVGGTFVIAYALHKCFMPVRLMGTCIATPLVVGFLRRRGILKPHTRKE